jgi:hypothetical protein
MRLGWHLRGWIVVLVASLALTLLVAIPPAYIRSPTDRHVFVGVMIPGMCAVYMWLLHRFVSAPMAGTLHALKRRQAKTYTGGPTALTKEMRKIQAAVGILAHENEMMRLFVEEDRRNQSDPSDVVENSMTPARGSRDDRTSGYYSAHQTPATIARDVLRSQREVPDARPSGKPAFRVRRKSRVEAAYEVAQHVRSGTESKQQVPADDAEAMYTPGDPCEEQQPMRSVFSVPCSDDELSLHSFPPSPANQ